MFFVFLYKHLFIHFENDITRNSIINISMIDYFTLSVTIQAGIGFSDLYPISRLGKLVLMIHQFVVISTHVFTLYIFTI